MYWIDIPTTLRLLVCLRWHADVLNIHSNHSSSSCLSQIACWCTKYVFQTIFFFFLSGSDYMLMYWIYIPTTLRLLVWLRWHADVLNIYSNHFSSSCLARITQWCTEYILQPFFFFLSGSDYMLMYLINIPTTLLLLVWHGLHADVQKIYSKHTSCCLVQMTCRGIKYIFQTFYSFSS